MNAGWILLGALVGLAMAARLIFQLLPVRKPHKLAEQELVDLEREEYVLRKNMRHDKHRLAYIVARRRELKASQPIPVVRRESVVTFGLFDRWSRRDTAPALLVDERKHESRQ